MKSSLEKLPLKQLVYISQKLIEKEFDYKNPYLDYDEDIEKLDRLLEYFGIDANQIDLDFIAKFISENEELILSLENNKDFDSKKNSFVIPKLGKFTVYYEMWGPATYTEKYKTEWHSYDKSWVKDSIEAARNEGTWSDYDGDYLEHEYDNWEPDNFQIDFIKNLNEEKINSLQKTTLLELKNLIDKKLKNL